MKRLRWCALGFALSAGQLGAQRVTVADLGPGGSGRVLQEILARPHQIVEPDTGWFILPRGEQRQGSLVVLGRTAAISGLVDGDVVVVGGDLHVRPGARIGGRAVAIGGGVYSSPLATIGAGTQSYRDNTFAIARVQGGYRLEYRSLRAYPTPPLLFPGIYGLRIPAYDRVSGASVPFGPAFSFGDGRGVVNLLATYRSDLGKIDPSLTGSAQLSRRSRIALSAQRGTFTNDAWIWPGYVNSMSVLVFGEDTRNYYRADRAELSVHRLWETTRTQLEPFIGAVFEKAWTVGPGFGEQRGPWSIWGKSDSLGIWRPNPPIEDGDITAVIAGTGLDWESQELRLRARTRGELALAAPSDQQFTQLTSDVEVVFPTFGEQEYSLDVHWVTTMGDTPPPQRFVYLGGSGTLPFLDLLARGGDELLLIDQRYAIPILQVRIGILGIPTLLLRHRIAGAGVGKMPDLEQMLGAGVLLTILRVELQFDPERRQARLSTGFSFSR